MNGMYENNYQNDAFRVDNVEGYANRGTNQFHENSVRENAVMPVNCEDAMKITSFEDLRNYASGTVVRFPDFAEGQPFVARVRRPSLLVLAKSGKIPNSLLTTAGSLFTGAGGGMNANDPKMLGEVHDVCEVICEAALIQPTLADIHNAGIELSDDQLMAIFSYTQTGVKALESFRKK